MADTVESVVVVPSNDSRQHRPVVRFSKSVSKEPTLEEEVPAPVMDVLSVLDWFNETFTAVASHELTITMAEWEMALRFPNFAQNLYLLFDYDSNGEISMEELMGGLSQLTTAKHKKVKELNWFEETFTYISEQGEVLRAAHFEMALKTDMFTENLFYLFDVHKVGTLTVPELIEGLGRLTVSNRDIKWLAWLEERFSKVAGGNRKISLADFKDILKVSKDDFFAKRFFTLFDEDKTGSISLRELINGVTLLTQGSQEDKLKFVFKVYDVNDSGTIDYDELRTVLVSCMTESRLRFPTEKIDELTDILYNEADAEGRGSITFDQFFSQLSQYPGVIDNLTFSASDWLKGSAQPKKKSFFHDVHPFQFVLDNITLVVFLAIYFSVNIVLFVEAAHRHRAGGVFVAIARGCGQCLNFNPVLLLILMMRQSITKIRGTHLSHFLPLDHYIELHKLVGYMVVLFSSIHVIAHLINFTRLELTDQLVNITAVEFLFSVGTPLGWVGGAAGLTGWFLTIILAIIFICALPIVRRKGFFEVFYWTHNLFVIWYIILILHGPFFWYWFIGPAVIYIIERIVRSRFFKFILYGRTFIEEGIVLPSNVVHLVISRPPNFKYKPGDYILINIPSVARYEWHPFTISSAPEQQGVIWLHIRAVGTWTKKLLQLYESIDLDRGRSYSMRLSVHRRSLSTNQHARISIQAQSRRKILIDGPYGTPSVHIFEAEHAVLIGAGIGVTPFASILQSIAAKHKAAKHVCPNCTHEWVEGIPQDLLKLRKVDFFWINRDQRAFEWFVTLLAQLESEKIGDDAFLSLNMYMTSALRKNDMKAIGLHMALDLAYEKQNCDLITGLRTRTIAGRPDWDEVFKRIETENKGRVTIFFCGPVALSAILRRKCQQYGFSFRKENF